MFSIEYDKKKKIYYKDQQLTVPKMDWNSTSEIKMKVYYYCASENRF